jgi:sarcosine oxidase
MSPTYDLIVLGTGGVGSATAWRAAQRGARVLALDALHPPHRAGSSHGQTRAIRMAYFEHPDYVPLLRRAYALWDELEELHQQSLFMRCGLLQVGPENGRVIQGVRKAANQHQLPLEQLSIAQAQATYPQFRFPESAQILFEANAGYLRVDDCVSAQIEQALSFGAELKFDEPVRSWKPDGTGFRVVTDRHAYLGKSLALTAGPWIKSLDPPFNVPLRVIRKCVYFYSPMSSTIAQTDITMSYRTSPVYFFETEQGFFYGFPQIDERGIKVGRHSGTGPEFVEPAAGELDELEEDSSAVGQFVTERLMGVRVPHRERSDCWYTMSPDEHFLVDRLELPGSLAYAAGLSGHGFKFAPVLGEVLADILLDGSTSLPIEFLQARRFGLRG